MQNVILKGDVTAYKPDSGTGLVTAMAIDWDYRTGIGTVYVKLLSSAFWHKTTARPYQIRNIVNVSRAIFLDGGTKDDSNI